MREFENEEVRKIGKQIELWRSFSNSLTLAELIRKVIDDRCLIAINSIHPNGRQNPCWPNE
jgi:hypothetical protein